MKKLIVIVGPTGTGKTDLALALAKRFDGEIVSADSRQIYTGMDIGTGKIDPNSKILDVRREKERWVVDGIPIHLYDVITPDKTFSVATYQQAALRIISGIHKENKLPILVGGTGLYIRAIVEGLKIPKVAPNQKLRAQLESRPISSLARELERVDPQTAGKIDRANQRRIIRALEVYHQTGESLSKLKGKFKVNFDTLKIGLTSDRDFLYTRVDARIDTWIKTGFVEEVKELVSKGYKEASALKTLGYQQIVMYLEGKISLEEAAQRIKFRHHNYIRQQTTWFRKETGISWFNIAMPDFRRQIFEKVQSWPT